MASTHMLWPGYELNVDQQSEMVWTDLPQSDEHWTFVDAEGHGHFWQRGASKRDDHYPTLRWIVEPCTMGHDDCDGEGHYECVICGEEIRPGTRPADPIRIDGLRSITLTVTEPGRIRVYALTDDLWATLDAGVREAVDALLPDENIVDMRLTGPSR